MPAWLWAVMAGIMTSLLAIAKKNARATACCDFDCEDKAETTAEQGVRKAEHSEKVRELYRRPFTVDSKSDAGLQSITSDLSQIICYSESQSFHRGMVDENSLLDRDVDVRAQFSYEYVQNSMDQVLQSQETKGKCVPNIRMENQQFALREQNRKDNLPTVSALSKSEYPQRCTPQTQCRPFAQRKQCSSTNELHSQPLHEYQLPQGKIPFSELSSQRQAKSRHDPTKIQESQLSQEVRSGRTSTESKPGTVFTRHAVEFYSVYPSRKEIGTPTNIRDSQASEHLNCCGCANKCQYQCEDRIEQKSKGVQKLDYPRKCSATARDVRSRSIDNGGPCSAVKRIVDISKDEKRYQTLQRTQQSVDSSGQNAKLFSGNQQEVRLRNTRSLSPAQRAPIPQNISHRKQRSYPQLPKKGEQLLKRLDDLNTELSRYVEARGKPLTGQVNAPVDKQLQRCRSNQNDQPVRYVVESDPAMESLSVHRTETCLRVDSLLTSLIGRTVYCVDVLSDLERFIRRLRGQLRNIKSNQ